MPLEQDTTDPEESPASDQQSVEGLDSVGISISPQNPEFLHRPHAFALTHGDGGPQIAYGQLFFRRDLLTLSYQPSNFGDSVDDTIETAGCEQGIIEPLVAHVPKIDSTSGDEMDPDMPNVYHQLGNGYGDVYLYFTIAFSGGYGGGDTTGISNVYVKVQPAGSADDSVTDVAAMSFSSAPYGALGENSRTGVYRVKLGTVVEDEPIKQFVSTDVYFSVLQMDRRSQGSGYQCTSPEFNADTHGDETGTPLKKGYKIVKLASSSRFVDEHFEVCWKEVIYDESGGIRSTSATKTLSMLTAGGTASNDAITSNRFEVTFTEETDYVQLQDIKFRCWPTDPFSSFGGDIPTFPS